MRRRLALWKRQYISKGGRITLIKSMLANMPLYRLSLFRMPKSVARRLEKLQRDFLWGGGSLERKVHLINWEVVCAQKEKGGLGIRKLVLLNKALLGKWIWRFANEKDNLWKKVVKYGQEGFGGGLMRVLWEIVLALFGVQWVFPKTEAISGLKINLEESELSLMGSVPYVEDLVAELGCRQRDLPTFYLGLSFGEPFKSRGPGIKNLSIVKVTKIKNLAILKVTKTKKLSILNSPWSVSDHCLIVLEGGGVMMGKVPFKFENMWLKAVGSKI
ncbi:putative ribonuclease H protein [Vitis vinifera]|uniref:Putative ribonuclease H protein n=1 Tax=Vitis vinifera TaxID=29760 RepID=A0A438H8P9_VITVI|nr:putative ribonuclease H protein [Vitis vinifera]